jgi:hypothetical protein
VLLATVLLTRLPRVFICPDRPFAALVRRGLIASVSASWSRVRSW